MMISVHMCGLGHIEHKLNLADLIDDLNSFQKIYRFYRFDSLGNLPAPTERRSDQTHDSPQYDADVLFAYMKEHRRVSPRQRSILVGIIDSEIFDDLYSTIDRENSSVLISLRSSELTQVLEASRKSFLEYAELELSAQLLALEYRRRAHISASPNECAEPWHVERWNCLFDYYGLSPHNVTKLVQPRISPQILAIFQTVEMPTSCVDANMAIVRHATRRKWREVARMAPDDPLSTFAIGGLIGMFASIAASSNREAQVVFGLICAVAVLVRLAQIRRN